MANKNNCIKTDCCITNDYERMVSCSLCHNLCHFKCSGFSGLVGEAVNKSKNLRWYCDGCDKIGVEFHRFFQRRKIIFEKIQKDMSLLSNDISEYGKLFDDFKELETFNSPPQSSPKRRKSNRKNKENPDHSPSASNNTDSVKKTLGKPTVPPTAPASSTATVNSSETHSIHPPAPISKSKKPSTVNTIETNNESILPSTSSASTVLPPALVSNLVQPTAGNNFVTDTLENLTPRSTTSVSSLINKVIPNQQTPSSLNSELENKKTKSLQNKKVTYANVVQQSSSILNSAGNEIIHHKIRSIPRPKSIFISRLAPEITAEDINHYIKTKLNTDLEISTYKYSYAQPRSITSFKITVPADVFDQVVDPCFWPDYTLVKEYFYRENHKKNNIVHQNSVDHTASKN